MGDKRLKLARGLGNIIPVTVNFSQLEQEFDENSRTFEPSDDGLEQERLNNNIQYEELVIHILANLDPREKLVFMYQLLRDGGYQIDHGAFAKTLNVSRRQYMRVLETVRTKSMLYMWAYKKNQSHKEE